jgi:predicted TIM-barrel fold metal-dependent hydrolase
MLILDTHAHIYSPDETRYPPIDEPLRPPGGKGSLEDLRQESQANGVAGACIIQTSTFYRFDNRYICDSAKAAAGWTAGVCTLDPDDPHSPGLLRQYVREYGIRGMRSIAARNRRFDDDGVRALWKTALDEGIVINALSGLAAADQVDQLVGEFPALPVVLDHCLNPEAGPNLKAAVDQVLKMARRRNLHAKLTFLPTGSKTGYPCEDMHPACHAIIHAFGPERCVWGSDFPCELWTPRVSYAEHLKIFQEALGLSEDARAQILGETARRLWFPNLQGEGR